MGGGTCGLFSYHPSFTTVRSSLETCRGFRQRACNSKGLANGNSVRLAPMLIKSFFLSKATARRAQNLIVCMVLDERVAQPTPEEEVVTAEAIQADSMSSASFSTMLLANSDASLVDSHLSESQRKSSERQTKRKVERYTYLFAAVASSVGVTFLAAGAVYYRFAWQMQGSEVPLTEMFGTFSLAVGASVGMEFWARWAHRALWHASLWSMHESHHRPRDGPFELNDVFAIINAVPAIALLAYGFFHKGLVPGLCFGAGLGITVFGMAYMFVHDGLVHRRFPVGPIANVPYLQKVAAAHQLHHADKFDGVPYGLFLGPKELEEIGGLKELEKLMQTRRKGASENLEATDG